MLLSSIISFSRIIISAIYFEEINPEKYIVGKSLINMSIS